MTYRVTIRKGAGPEEVREIDAASRFEVYAAVEKEGGTVARIEEARRLGMKLPAWTNITIGAPVKRAVVIRIAKNISAMLTAGLSLARALSIVERQAPNKRAKEIIAGVEARVGQGAAFHEALGAYPKVFSGLFISMVRAGEESGTLADSLQIVSTQMERTEELTKKVRGAMIYPSIVVIAIIIVAVLMLLFVVPTLTATFKSLGVKLPLATRVIVAVSSFMTGNVLLVILGLLAFFGGATWLFRSEPGKNIILAFSLKLPVIGELVRETYAARAARTMASLLGSGVPVLEALAIARETVHAKRFAAVIETAEASVKKGGTLSAPFAEASKLYPLQMSEMIAVGEETGKVAEMLKEVAEYYEGDVAEKTKDLSTIIEPVLMLLIGGMVGIFAVSIIAPIYSLSSAI